MNMRHIKNEKRLLNGNLINWLTKLASLVVISSCSAVDCTTRLAIFDAPSAAVNFTYEANQPVTVHWIENVSLVDIFFTYDDSEVYTSSTPPKLSWTGWDQNAGGPGGPESREEILLVPGSVRYFFTPIVITRNFEFRSRTGAAFNLFVQWGFSLDDPRLR